MTPKAVRLAATDEIFYSRGNDVIATKYRVEGRTILFGEERVLFQAQELIGDYSQGASWAISPDGQRFLSELLGLGAPSGGVFQTVRSRTSPRRFVPRLGCPNGIPWNTGASVPCGCSPKFSTRGNI